ncbi:integrase arm-type DNA-binding domain-containing protein [Roseomonas sp. SG15]|uniref:Integrase arm-type DNA-binding domain-containing protein n=2 Tax=Roseomonas indoligenes TaxID=2820811 RepID=A0A940S8D9_9PROT|nr:site-specific integrase [Pararoseomonas indoligenes]MBP0494007.1 integrase arm-type DNA-binding domain-containing protein [Pararoseomonas indoligenes]
MAGKLTALKIKALTSPGRYGDGGGLWLQVRDADHRSWLFRYTLHGRAREMGLGPFPDVSLADARQQAQTQRALLRAGVDPLARRQEEKAAAAAEAKKKTLTFKEVAQRYHAAHQAGWRNEKHRHQWATQMEAYVYPVFGKMPVDRVGTAEVMKALEPIWHEKSQTAVVQRGRIEAVLDYAKAREWRLGENPARWRGHLAKLLPPRSRITKTEHHAALPWAEVGDFMEQVRASPDLAARALEFLILTAVRTNEAMGAEWTEINTTKALWVIPAERMKGKKEHRVPLSAPALALLDRIRSEQGEVGRYVFPSPRGKKPLSTRACAVLLGRMKRTDFTVHGFRSTFRDWVAERTSFPREIGEMALAHTVGSAVERAYQRSELLVKRAQLMEAWGRFCGQPSGKGEVVPIRGQG